MEDGCLGILLENIEFHGWCIVYIHHFDFSCKTAIVSLDLLVILGIYILFELIKTSFRIETLFVGICCCWKWLLLVFYFSMFSSLCFLIVCISLLLLVCLMLIEFIQCFFAVNWVYFSASVTWCVYFSSQSVLIKISSVFFSFWLLVCCLCLSQCSYCCYLYLSQCFCCFKTFCTISLNMKLNLTLPWQESTKWLVLNHSTVQILPQRFIPDIEYIYTAPSAP